MKMRKIIFIIAAVLCCNFALKAQQQPPQPQDLPPHNEIWYTTSDGSTVSFSQTDITVVSNEYKDGKGVVRFNKAITEISDFKGFSTGGAYKIKSITFPVYFTNLSARMAYYKNLESITFSSSYVKIDEHAFDAQSTSYPAHYPSLITFVSEGDFTKYYEMYENLYPHGVEFSMFSLKEVYTAVINAAAQEYGVSESNFNVYVQPCIDRISDLLPEETHDRDLQAAEIAKDEALAVVRMLATLPTQGATGPCLRIIVGEGDDAKTLELMNPDKLELIMVE